MIFVHPCTSYMAPIQSNSMISIGSNHHSDIQRFFQDFRLPDYTLDNFSGRLLDVVSNTTFSSGDVQSELCHAIMRFIISACILELWFPFYQTILFLDSWILSVIFFYMYRLFDIYKPGMCHFIDHEASLGNAPCTISTGCFTSSMWSNQRGYTMIKKQLSVSVLCLFYC